MRIWIAVLITFCLAVTVGCEAPEEEQEAPKAKEKGPEVEAKRVEIKYVYPVEQAHKTAKYELIFRDEAYEYDGYALEHQEKVEALKKAVANLLPSDTMLTCNPNPAKPTFLITVPIDGAKITLVSSSNCTNWAPWNVIKDGKLYAQIDGTIGEALLPLLQEVSPQKFKEVSLPMGAFPLGAGEKPAEGVEAQVSVSMSFLASVQQSEPVQKALGARKIVDLKLICEQAASRSCASVGGVASVELAEGFLFEFPVTIGPNGVEALELPDFSVLDTTLAGDPAQALKTRATNSVRVAYAKEGQCDAVKAAATIYKPDTAAEELGCEQFMMVAAFTQAPEAVPPSLVYFPSLGASWISLAAANVDMTFFEDLETSDEVNEALEANVGAFFVNAEGAVEVVK